MKVGSLYRGRKFLTPESILHLYKSIIRPGMENCCHLWAGASVSVLSLLDRIQKRVANIIRPELACKLQPLSIRRDVASLSLLYRYFHGHCSSELSSLVPPVKTFNRRTNSWFLLRKNHYIPVVSFLGLQPCGTHSLFHVSPRNITLIPLNPVSIGSCLLVTS